MTTGIKVLDYVRKVLNGLGIVASIYFSEHHPTMNRIEWNNDKTDLRVCKLVSMHIAQETSLKYQLPKDDLLPNLTLPRPLRTSICVHFWPNSNPFDCGSILQITAWTPHFFSCKIIGVQISWTWSALIQLHTIRLMGFKKLLATFG